MREILFRGKRADNGEWVEGDLLQTRYHSGHIEYQIMPQTLTAGVYRVLPETVGQYTGLTDKNGKRIFEGDIVKNNWCFIYSPSVVRFGEYFQQFNDDIHTKHIGFYIEHSGKHMNTCMHDLGYFANKCEVIGNIRDNPELLGKEDT